MGRNRRQRQREQTNDARSDYHHMEDDAEDGRQRQSDNHSNNRNNQQHLRDSTTSTSSDDDAFDQEYDIKKERPYNAMNNNNTVGDDEEETYIVRQDYPYCSYLFSGVQCLIMILLLWQCGRAPMNINPMIGPYPDALSEWGGKNAVLILQDGEWWRLITPILLHAGLLHLVANVAVQVDAGAFFEKEWGSVRWLVIYLTSAVASSICSVIFMPQAVSVGSSGAVMGLFGGKLAEVLLRCAERDDTDQAKVSHQVRKEQCVAVTCSVVLVMAFSFIPYVDWAAHLGGLIGGLVVGCFVFALELEWVPCRAVWILMGLAMTVIMFVMGLRYMYEEGNVQVVEELRGVCGYYKQMFEDYECRCMKDEMMQNNGEDGDHDRRML
mmetsp:Transcript_13203/g.28991  ORF Transcript_13203/g.28991 Transcript_13203/m.28991 type:complete len:381 (+) Transcript_13203:268-1410(+)